jgi:hypothetical protein
MQASNIQLGDPALASAPAQAGAPSLFDDLFVRPEILNRIYKLQENAVEEGEPVSRESFIEMLDFLERVPFTRRPGLFLLDNGNFRAVWRTEDNEQAAFQFRGNAIVHCVFFYKRDSQALPLSRETVVDLVDRVATRRAEFAHILTDPAYDPAS